MLSMVLMTGGAAVFALGIRTAFGQSGNWSNLLAGLGILLVGIAATCNLVSLVFGAADCISERRILWWWPLSLLVAIGTGYVGSIALNL